MSSEEVNEFGVSMEALERYSKSFNKSETLAFFNTRVEFPDVYRVQAIIDELKSGHMGGMGKMAAVNGGVLAALYDLVVGCSAALVDPARRSATIQLSMNFERPVTGDEIIAEATVDRAGKTLVFSSARILDGQGRVCSHGQGVVRMSKRGWDNGSPAVN